MRELLRKYNKILRVELEELVEDLKIILESHHQKTEGQYNRIRFSGKYNRY